MLKDLPLQQKIISDAVASFEKEEDVLAAVLVGSLSSGSGDSISDADILIITTNHFHTKVDHCFAQFEAEKSIFHSFQHQAHQWAFKKYIFDDFTSAEIHCIDKGSDFKLSKPYKVLFDKTNIISTKRTEAPPPKHEDFPAYQFGGEGLMWDTGSV